MFTLFTTKGLSFLSLCSNGEL